MREKIGDSLTTNWTSVQFRKIKLLWFHSGHLILNNVNILVSLTFTFTIPSLIPIQTFRWSYCFLVLHGISNIIWNRILLDFQPILLLILFIKYPWMWLQRFKAITIIGIMFNLSFLNLHQIRGVVTRVLNHDSRIPRLERRYGLL